ncbi:hypothetical protein BK122_21550 [Paenibacillus pabuli]|nr:hypothetical protein BK122_21550 [Paenibacillus pabuli]
MKSQQRNQAYYRHHRKRVIQRKKQLAVRYGWSYKFEGIFAKGKIHCSCWWCCEKTKRLGYPKSELSRIADCTQQLLNSDF